MLESGAVRVLSTFSGVSAATVAWAPFGYEFVGYSEPNPECAWILHHRLGTGRPRYMPQPDAPELRERLAKAERDLRQAASDVGLGRHDNEELVVMAKSGNDVRLENLRGHLKTWKAVRKEINERRKAIKRVADIPETGWSGKVNFGDVSQISDDDLRALGAIDVLEGGPPCQAFSVAGDRNGLADGRGNLSLVFCELAERMKEINGTRFVLFENVLGALTDETNAFGCILAAMVGEPEGQIFAPGNRWPHSGHVVGPDGRDAAWRVLESSGFSVAQRRARTFAVFDLVGGCAGQVLFERQSGGGSDPESRRAWHTVAGRPPRCSRTDHLGVGMNDNQTPAPSTIKSAAGFCQGNSPKARTIGFQREVSPTLRGAASGTNMVPAILFETDEGRYVRKLTPVECERLQGFPDNWTLVDTKDGKPMADQNRYRAIGNSMTVNVMAFAGERLMEVILEERNAEVRQAA